MALRLVTACRIHSVHHGARGRVFSVAAASSLKSTLGAEGTGTSGPSSKAKADKEGIFSRHGGKMVLGFLGGVGVWFFRGHLGNKKFEALKEEVEMACPLEPFEAEDLRCANDYPPGVFPRLLKSVEGAFPSGRATYTEFVMHVTSSGLLSHPITLGHLLDRVVLARRLGRELHAGARAGGTAEGQGSGIEEVREEDEPMLLDTGFLMVAFSCAINTTPEERIQQLWDFAWQRINRLEGNHPDSECSISSSNDGAGAIGGSREGGEHVGQGVGAGGEYIPAEAVAELVEFLMASYQVPAGKYVVKDGARKWPIQEYKLGTGEEVLHLALTSLHEQNEKATKGWIQRKTSPRFNPRDQFGRQEKQQVMEPFPSLMAHLRK